MEMEDDRAYPVETHPDQSHPDQTHPVQSHPELTHPAGEQGGRAGRLEACRRAYADQIAEQAGIDPGSEIAAALAAIPRERFVGPPPWNLRPPSGYLQTAANDPVVLYQDVVVPLGRGWGLNNGQPSLHAMCLAALAPQKGEHALHVGAGTGYYTTILAMLVGETGRVDAYEIEPELAERARANLKEFAQAAVHCRSGAEGPLPDCDVLYVSAAAAEPLAVWLDALRPEGRLLFPLAAEGGSGEMLLVTRKTDGTYAARLLISVQFVRCAGAQDEQAGRALNAAFWRGGGSKVRWLHRNDQPDESCWCAGRVWWLGTESGAGDQGSGRR
jgi:protein-L-isoaspartate(D-aspartate) O-methyltransferase